MCKTILLVCLLVSFGALSGCGGNDTVKGQDSSATRLDKIYQWRMVTTWPKNLPGLGVAPVRMAEMISTMSNGRLNITVYGAGELVPAMGVFDAVSLGNVEMGHGAAYYWKGKSPAAQ